MNMTSDNSAVLKTREGIGVRHAANGTYTCTAVNELTTSSVTVLIKIPGMSEMAYPSL